MSRPAAPAIGPASARQSRPVGRSPGPILLSVQYLRGIAAAGVVLFHASGAAGRPHHAGALGVDIFFVISGFLMVTITDQESRPARFMRDRILRIVPLYWVALLAMVALNSIGLLGRPSAAQIAASFAFLPNPGAAAPYFPPILPVGWTLNFEMFFYTMFAATLLLPRRVQLAGLSAIFVLLVAAGALIGPAPAPLRFWMEPVILEFLAGAWIGAFWRRGGGYSAAVGFALILGAVFAYFLVHVPLPLIPSVAESRVVFLLPAGLLLLAALQFERRPGGLPQLAVLKRLGDASYSIYLWHPFFLYAVLYASRELGLPRAMIFPLASCAGIAGGLLAYRLLEAPLLRLLRRRREQAW